MMIATDEDTTPTCDLCGEPEQCDRAHESGGCPAHNGDWNGETGNHRSCEAAPCRAIVYMTGSPAECGLPSDTEWVHYNRDDSRAIDHEYTATAEEESHA